MEAKPQIFLSYASEDEEEVRRLYERLSRAGFSPWMDKINILPGEDWDTSIKEAIRRSDFVLICLSARSVGKRGYFRKEIIIALDLWNEKLRSDIYLIPVRLEPCQLPDDLTGLMAFDLFKDADWARLLGAFREGLERRRTTADSGPPWPIKEGLTSAVGGAAEGARPERPPAKRPWVALGALAVWAALVFVVIWPWMHRFDKADLALSVLAHLSAAIWWGVLLWAFHHLAYQLGAIFAASPAGPGDNPDRPTVALLYTTCDDFLPECCQSCLDQDYPRVRVLICDDSRQERYREMVRAFHAEHSSRCELITRPDRKGFKAGNLNHAIEKHVVEDWVLLVDADQSLPRNYLSQFASRLPRTEQVAFVQAAHQTMPEDGRSSYFQSSFSPEVKLYYSRDLSLRERFGFVPLLGHGAMVRRAVWQRIGGFPEVVSEDFAFTLRAANEGLSGRYVQEVVSDEGFPYDFGGFVVRLGKFAKGTAELLRREIIPFLGGPASPTEKWDFMMMLFWYVLMSFVTVNGFLGAYVCHRLWREGLPYLQPVLPYLYTWMLLSIFAVNVSVARSLAAALRFYFWATAVYTAAMPVAGVSFIKHLFIRPSFERTPKNQGEKLGRTGAVLMSALGVLAVACSLVWLSPFSPILLGQGVAYSSYPLYGKLCSDSRLGSLSRLLIYLPGLFMLFALYALWRWGRF